MATCSFLFNLYFANPWPSLSFVSIYLNSRYGSGLSAWQKLCRSLQDAIRDLASVAVNCYDHNRCYCVLHFYSLAPLVPLKGVVIFPAHADSLISTLKALRQFTNESCRNQSVRSRVQHCMQPHNDGTALYHSSDGTTNWPHNKQCPGESIHSSCGKEQFMFMA